MMRRLALMTLTFLLVAALVAACAGAVAPAAEQAAAPAQEEAAAVEEAVPGDVEMPQPDPADQAEEATDEPSEESATPASVDAAGVRAFRLAPGQSSMQYAVEEEFFGQAIPFVTAVGTTNAISGELTLRFDDAGVTIEQGSFTADISTLASDQGRRDRAIRDRWLESSRYPYATFVASEVANMPADAALGKEARFQVSGDMTIRDVTNPMTWEMSAMLDGETLTGTGTTYFLMKDFGFEPPDIAGILRVTDGVTVTVNFVANEVR